MNNSILYISFIFHLMISLNAQSSYSLQDVNPNSENYGNFVGTSFFEGKVIMHYFGAFTWGTCTARFGELNDIYANLKNQGFLVELIGVSKSSWSAGLVNWVNQGSASICVDDAPYPVWDSWEATQRDLFITDKNGNIVFRQNITAGIPDDIINIIFSYLSFEEDILPNNPILEQNYPNPFNPITSINYEVTVQGAVSITVHNTSGELVKTLIEKSQTIGSKSIKWNATDNKGRPVSGGLYLYTIQMGNFRSTKKMILLK